ncbi:hypothetical protein BBI11_03800 [Planococcus maritimus]|uniref:hypothetical protein n=1 Tax=Planococcus maritimus TaxID=192421 RepID=UPI00080F1A04|nr:hypothetical protein [Planococcus maritimus]ANU16229.1 hypothetical protein BBI11_03800 [Planococcus maritimus]
MNVAEAAYDLGNELRQHSDGKKFFELYTSLKKYTSSGAWNLFIYFQKRSGLNHYGSIVQSYETIKKIDLKDHEHYKARVEEILLNKQFEELSKQAKKLTQSLSAIVKDLLSPGMPRKFNGEVAKPKLKRVIQSLYVAFHRTGLIKYIENEFKKVEYRPMLNNYVAVREVFPFSKKNRVHIERISKSDVEKSFLYTVEAFSSFLEFINQLIYESHLNLISINSRDEFLNLRTAKFNRMEVYKLNGKSSDFEFKEGSLIKLEDNGKIYFGIMYKRITSFSKNSVIVTGYLYPNCDLNIFKY